MSTIDFSALLIECFRDPVVIAEIEQAVGRAIKKEFAGKLTSEPDGLISVKEAGKIAGVTDETIRNWITKGKLHANSIAGSRYRITKADLNACLKPCLQTPVDPEEEARKVISFERRRRAVNGKCLSSRK